MKGEIKMEHSLFKSERLSNSVYRIAGISGEYFYLVEGDEKAVLLDTGLGVGNVREYVETLTSLPLFVILTHGHLDHVGGAVFFDEVYMSDKDLNLSKEHNTFDMRKWYLDFLHLDYDINDFAPVINVNYLSLKQGNVFDLGNLHLEILELAGHTQGSMVVVIQEEKSVLFGDACNSFTFMFDPYCSSINEYLNHLRQLKPFEDKWETIYLSHGSGIAPKEMLDEVIEVCEDILNRKVDDMPFQFMDKTVQIAKKIDERMSRVDGKIGNIVYDANRIH